MTIPAAKSIVEIDSLDVGYGRTPVVVGASATIRRSRLSVLVGPNGSGKSTFLKGVAGVLPPSAGHVWLNGNVRKELTGTPPDKISRLGLAYVPQLANTFNSLSVRENLELGLYGKTGDLNQALEYVHSIFPDLLAARRRPARTLSGGQREMLALGRALMAQPLAILVDEPTAGLSPRYQVAVWQQLLALRQAGVALLVVEQNTRAALEVADDAYVLVAGQIRRSGDARTLLDDEELVKLYIGVDPGVRP